MLCRSRSGLKLDVDMVSSEEDQEKIEDVGEEAFDSGKLKDRVNAALDGGVSSL